ncbi:MAG: hypothetical protein V4735_05760 [Pseudomonadota bacterium]
MERYKTYEELNTFEKCVIEAHSQHYMYNVGRPLAVGGAVPYEELQKALVTLEDVTLAVGGIENLIATINSPSHPELPMFVECLMTHPPVQDTPATPVTDARRGR